VGRSVTAAHSPQRAPFLYICTNMNDLYDQLDHGATQEPDAWLTTNVTCLLTLLTHTRIVHTHLVPVRKLGKLK
jgi:hypothetical protein